MTTIFIPVEGRTLREALEKRMRETEAQTEAFQELSRAHQVTPMKGTCYIDTAMAAKLGLNSREG